MLQFEFLYIKIGLKELAWKPGLPGPGTQLHAAHLAPTVSALRERGRGPLRLPCEHGRGVRIWNLAVDIFHGFPTGNKESVNKLLDMGQNSGTQQVPQNS